MATVRGKAEVRAYINGLPTGINKLLKGAARAGAMVIADEAKQRSLSSEVADAVKVATEVKEGSVVGKVQVKGPGAYIAPWLEYGTAPHFISVDDSQRMGMSVGRINARHKEGSLVINGQYVGATVHHPGARPHPFLRPALDTKATEAIDAAQTYIKSHLSAAGIDVSNIESGDEG